MIGHPISAGTDQARKDVTRKAAEAIYKSTCIKVNERECSGVFERVSMLPAGRPAVGRSSFCVSFLPPPARSPARLSVRPSFHPSAHTFVVRAHPSFMRPSLHASCHPHFAHPCVHASVRARACPSVRLSLFPSMCIKSVCMSINPSVRVSFRPSVRPSICAHVHVYIHLYVFPSVRRSVRPSLHACMHEVKL